MIWKCYYIFVFVENWREIIREKKSEISSYITGKTSTAIYSEAYKILKRDGKVVGSQLLSKDTYKRH